MAPVVLGLDIGGANLKAATADKRAVSVPFALWKQPDRLPAALAELVAKFPGADELAVTMTGELCDCFETKREGVNAILDAVQGVSRGRRVRVWGTGGAFVTVDEARRDHLKVAAANWHALATFAGRYAPEVEIGFRDDAILIDVGSTTTDIIWLDNGRPCPRGTTDPARLESGELVYVGVRRTPVCALVGERTAAELFATTQDVYVLLGDMPEEPENRDTADNRPLTVGYSHARLARMMCGDAETVSRDAVKQLARRAHIRILGQLSEAIRARWGQSRWGLPSTVILAGAGEFLAGAVVEEVESVIPWMPMRVSLNRELGPVVSACAPAYAVAVLATERPGERGA